MYNNLLERQGMDLIYKAEGHNQTRLRVLKQIMGTSTDISALSSDKAPFSIWCGDEKPSTSVDVWWQDTGLSKLQDIINKGAQDFSKYPNLKLIVFEQSVPKSIENMKWSIVISRDNIIRTFQSENDICLYLREIAARYV